MSDLAAAWTKLETAAQGARERPIASLFATEPDRLARLTLEAPELFLDLSKQPWSSADQDVALHRGLLADDQRPLAGDLALEAPVDAHGPLEVQFALVGGSDSEEGIDLVSGHPASPFPHYLRPV